MAPIPNKRVLFNEIPIGFPEPGKTTVLDTNSTIDLEKEPLNGRALVKTLVLSIDPYLRGQMRPADIESYMPPFIIGQPIFSFGVGKVVRSEHEKFKAGDIVYGIIDHAEYSIPNIDFPVVGIRVLNVEPGLPYSVYVGAAGMPGQTAYYGWKEYAEAKAGETVFVSGGAGPVGSIVTQLAKADGMKVIASAGTDAKVKFCKDVGADIVFNYKNTNTLDVLEKEGPLNVYWDNVGGSTLDAAMGNAANFARFIECGAISIYNTKDGVNLKNLDKIYARRIHLHGFIITDHSAKWQEEFYRVIPKKLVSGELKYTEDLANGLEHSGEAILEVQTGKNTGKKVIVVANE